MTFDRVMMVDWSGGNDRGPRPKKDAIWTCAAEGGRAESPVYRRNRQEAESALASEIEAALIAGRRLLVGLDFPFGYPEGFAAAIAGRPDPFALWRWIADRMEDGPRANARFDVAALMNRCLPGIGPFWGNALKRDIDDLPRRGNDRTFRWAPARRACERLATGAFEVWQLSGAGSVGGQVLTGLPVLDRLRARFAPHLEVWPFEGRDAPVLVAEIWPSLIADAVRTGTRPGEIRDAAQVRLLAGALSGMPPDALAQMLAGGGGEEGWILGLGQEAVLAATATARAA